MARAVQDAPLLAAMVLAGTVLALSIGDALMRKTGLSADIQMSLWQIFLLRSGRWALLNNGPLMLFGLLYDAALFYIPSSVKAVAHDTLTLLRVQMALGIGCIVVAGALALVPKCAAGTAPSSEA